MSERARDAFDVAVVGCGPVGGVLATLLGRAGHRVMVLERHATPYQPGFAAALPIGTVAWFVGIGGAVVTITEGDDVDGTYAEWFRCHDVAAVLQRPDFHLFGAASGAGPGARLVEALRAALDEPFAHSDPMPSGGTP